jgi:hypothetical protein
MRKKRLPVSALLRDAVRQIPATRTYTGVYTGQATEFGQKPLFFERFFSLQYRCEKPIFCG